MKNIMKRAWEIAREGQSKFGGKAVEYFAEALKNAWAEAKGSQKATITTSSGSRKHKSWVAEIIGTHPRWGFARKFVEADEETWMEKTYSLADGIYEVCDAGDREFIQAVNGQVEYIDYSDVMEQVA